MTPVEQIDLIRFMFDQWKEAKRDLIAFNVAFNVIRSESPQLEATLDKLIENARHSEAVQKFAASRFAGFEELINNIGEGTVEKAIREFQERAGSKFPIH
jgi:hypothetical protein